MSEVDISLFNLLNLAIGTPQPGAVNFSALHVLLHAMLRHLDIRDVKTLWKDTPTGEVHPDASVGANQEQEGQPGIESQARVVCSSSLTPEADGQKLLSRIQTCEDGLSKAMMLIQELHDQKDNLKKEMKEEMKELHHLQKTPFTNLEKCCHRVDALEDTVSSLRDSFQKYPDPEELSQFVTWDVMQSTLLTKRENLQKDPLNSEVDPATSSPSSSSTHLVQDPGSPAAPGPTSVSTKEAPSVTRPETGLTAPKSTGSERYPETVEALRDVGKLKERFSKLEARVAALEKGKVDQTQLTHLRELIASKGSRDALKNLMDELNQQRAALDDLRSDREKTVELVNTVQTKILQIQAECEKLHETTRCLHDDNRQKQSRIEELYRTTEELQDKKADKQMVETEMMKADKSEKVSRLQFDSATEELNTMFHELLNKVTGQEQDWHKVIDRLSTEMECKLNRIELDSVKKQLEDRWRNIQAKLQAQEAPEHEDAAAVRKQLVDRFHCLSCDRPVVMHTSGQHLVKLPSTAGFPSHRSMRPFTVYALEQLRQHYRSDRISEMSDYTHLVSRSCGGSHTVTSAGQRRSGLQHLKPHVQPEGDAVIQSEVDIVGLDGHIYKGRLNAPASKNAETKLPTISTKEGKTKDKVKSSTSHKAAASPEIHQPLSAKSPQGSHSASSCSGRDWPVSALGCPSQSSVTAASATADGQAEPPAGDTQHQ